MTTMPDVIETLNSSLIPLRGIPADYDPILDLIGNARVVLLGEASHGTQDFYATRVAITERLIRDRQFCAVAVEADWPDAYRVNRYVRPALSGSYKRLFHETGVPRFYLSLQEPPIRAALADPRLERAIGVIYRPETERTSHYFHASLPAQFDGLLHFDQTTALRPLETTAEWASEEVPETFPTGF